MCIKLENHCFRGWEFKKLIYKVAVFHAPLGCSSVQEKPGYKNEHVENGSLGGDFSVSEKRTSGSLIWLNLGVNLKQDLEFSSLIHTPLRWDGKCVC